LTTRGRRSWLGTVNGHNKARSIAETQVCQQSRKDLKKVEMLFAHLKRILKLDRLRLRGRSGAQDEFVLAATAQIEFFNGMGRDQPS
jgi:hypothetical protein